MSQEVSHTETEGTADRIEVIARKYSFSINADTLARHVSAHEKDRLRSRSKLPPEQILVRLTAYMEQKIGAKITIKPTTISNIGTIGGELKMIEGNSAKQLTDDMTLYVDTDAVAQLQMKKTDFRTDKKITYLGTDPTLSLEERLKQQEIAALQATNKADEGQDEDWREITHVRKIGAGAVGVIEDIPDLVIPTPTKSA